MFPFQRNCNTLSAVVFPANGAGRGTEIHRFVFVCLLIGPPLNGLNTNEEQTDWCRFEREAEGWPSHCLGLPERDSGGNKDPLVAGAATRVR